ncbi:MAG: YitT family protein [Erysipelothrix sp.]|nr:YitT family protein [Erysipelothrix sp.]
MNSKIVWHRSDVKKLFLVTLGALVTAIGFKIFVASNHLVPSGFTGVATLISRVGLEYFNIKISFSVVYLVLNMVPAVIVYRFIGRKFTILSIINVMLVSFFTSIIPDMTFTNDMLLVCVFGGVVQASGTLLALKADACSGGTDFIAIYFSQRYGRSVWNYVLLFNSAMLFISGVLFSFEPALYSLLYQFTNTQVVNAFHDRYHLMGITIITKLPDEVSKAIFGISRRGITQYSATGKYGQSEQYILYMVVGGNEAANIRKMAASIDPHSFITESKVDKVTGNFYVKPFE